MTEFDSHPSPDRLAAFASGELSLDDVATIGAHLEGCEVCCAALETTASADPFVAGLRSFAHTEYSLTNGAHDAGRASSDTAPLSASNETTTTALPSIPGYAVIRMIGCGGTGVVYEARHLELDRTVALKVMRAAFTATPAELFRFRSEALAVARLQHPNVVQVFDAGTFGGQPYVALEYVAGGSLAAAVAGAPQPPRDAARLVAALCDGVAAAHAAGIVHRDLKPANVLLAVCSVQCAVCSDDAKAPASLHTAHCTLHTTPKIADFGLAKLLDVSPAATASGTVAGTPSYMAPEQAAGRPDVGPAADVYALGAILYELLTGRPPFQGASILETLDQVRWKEPVPPGRLRSNTPRDLETIALKCLEKEPAKRYASATALGDDLRLYLDGRPIAARPVGVAARAAKWARRRPAVAALLAALALAVVGGVAGVGYQLVQTEAARRRAQVNVAELTFDEGLRQFREGDVAAGLRSMARTLQELPAGEADLEFAARVNFTAWRPRLQRTRVTPRHDTAVTASAFSPDGRSVLTVNWGMRMGNPSPALAQLWDPSDLSRPRLTVEHPEPLRSAAFHPGGATFVAGDVDGAVIVCDAATGRPAREPLRHDGIAWAVAFSPDGTRLAVGVTRHEPENIRKHVGGAVAVYRYPSCQAVGEPISVPFTAFSLAWGPAGDRVAVGGMTNPAGQPGTRGGAVTVVDADTGSVRGPPLALSDPVRAVAFAPDGALATGGDEGTVRFWEPDGQRRAVVLRHPMRVNSIAFARGGSLVVTGCGNQLPNDPYEGPGEVRVWNAATGEAFGAPLKVTQPKLCNMVHTAAVSPDGTLLAAASENGRAWVTPLPAAEAPLAAAKLPRRAILTFSPDGRTLVAVVSAPRALGYENLPAEVMVLDAATLRPLGSAQAPTICLPEFHPDGRRLLLVPEFSITANRGVRLIELPTATPVPLPPALSDGLACAAWGDAGRLIVTVDTAGTLRRWDADTFAPVGPPIPGVGQVAPSSVATRFAVSGDGRWLVAQAGETATLWSVADGRGTPLSACGDGGLWYAFSDDGKTLVETWFAGAGRSRVQVWELPSGRSLGPPRDMGEYNNAQPTPDGRVLMLTRSFGDRAAVVRRVDRATGAARSPDVPVGLIAVVSADGRVIAAPSAPPESEQVRLWGWAGKPLGPPVPHAGRVDSVAFSPDGRRLATCDNDGGLRVWAVPQPARGTPAELRALPDP